MPSREKLTNAKFREDQARVNETALDIRDLDPDYEDFVGPILPLSLTGMVLDWILPNPHRLRGQAEEFLGQLAAALTDLRDCPAVNRLIGLRQLGIKRDPHQTQWLGNKAIATAPFIHGRWTHSEFAAAHMIATILHLRELSVSLRPGTLAALLHDIGHSAFSHDGDEILHRLGYSRHEARGQETVRFDLDVRESMTLAHVDPEQVLQIMREDGCLGALLSICDTLAYVVLDSQIARGEINCSVSLRVIEAIRGVQEDGQILVTHTAPFEWLLHERARLSQQIYYHHDNMVAAEALKLALLSAIRSGILSPEDLLFGTDGEIEIKMSWAHNGPKRSLMPNYAWLAWDLAHGVSTPDGWAHRSFKTEEALQRDFNRLPKKVLPSTIIVRPFDYRRKRLKLITPDDQQHSVVVPQNFIREDERLYHLYFPMN